MTDRSTVRLVIVFLGVGFLLCVAGGFALAVKELPIPEFLVALGGGALGALGSLLARTSTDEPQNVNVVNTREDPVPVDDKPQVPPLPSD